MIYFGEYERIRLADVADFERAKAGHVYPAGTSTLQISATKGEIGFLEKPSTIKSKNAAIILEAGINPRYFNLIMHKNVAEFMKAHATGLNIQEDEVGEFPIDICNYETQLVVEKMLMFIGNKEQETQDEINYLMELKQAMLQRMFI